MADTVADLEASIAAIDAQIAVLVASPTSIASYTIGQKRVDKSQVMQGLLDAREMYQKRLDTFPAEDYNRLAIDVDDQGRDQSEYLGDADSE